MTSPARSGDNAVSDAKSRAIDASHSVSIDRRTMECVEVYIPKKLENLSEVYRYLREKMLQRGEHAEAPVLDGFSLYEVDGAFYGDQVYQERTLVIRLLFLRHEDQPLATLESQIASLGQEIATTVALKEAELWICHYPQRMMIFRPVNAGAGSSPAQEN